MTQPGPSTRSVFTVLLLVMLTIAACFSYGWMHRWQRDARLAKADHHAARQTAQQLIAARRQPALAAGAEAGRVDLAGPLERSTEALGLPQDQILRITGESPQRLGDSDYQELPTHVRFQSISLRELVALIGELTHQNPSLGVRNLRVVAPRDEPDSDRWTVDLTLTQLFYQPRHAPTP